MLVIYDRSEPGFRELDFDALSNEQALRIAEQINHVIRDYADFRDLLCMSVRLSRALNYIQPRVTTLKDLKDKPLDTWRTHPFLTPLMYHELREVGRPFGLRLPAWEMLP